MNARLDHRILSPGLAVTAAELVTVFVDHYRPDEAMTACTTCQHIYTPSEPACPSLVVVVPLLTRRRHEDPDAVPLWVREAVKEIKTCAPRRVQLTEIENVELFDSTPYRVARVPRQRRTTRALA